MIKLHVAPPHDHSVVIGRSVPFPTTNSPVAVIYDPKVAYLAEPLAESAGAESAAVTAGEQAKSFGVFEGILRKMALSGLPRDAELWAVGGGTITDLVGFVAATYLRGIAWRAWPTTTLAMVDAAIGGKTGINLPEGKNLVGAFHPPRGVYAELESLATLPRERFREGLVEAFKHGILSGDAVLLQPWRLSPDSAELEEYLARAAQTKIAVVEKDMRESGERAKLNLGHTLAHALEINSGHRLSHGQAVAFGMLYSALVAVRLGYQDITPHLEELLSWLEPHLPLEASWEDLYSYINRDKKKRGQEIRWVIPVSLGEAKVSTVQDQVLREAFSDWRKAVERYAG